MNTLARTDAGPWYREPWPWLLMLGPAIVIVAGSITAVFAMETFDGLVADDYYKQGVAINTTLHRDEVAQSLGYRAQLTLNAQGNRLELAFANAAPTAKEISLTFAHPTSGGFDRVVTLSRTADNHFVASLPPLAQVPWRLVLEDPSPAGQWRLTGQWRTGELSVQLAPTPK